MNRLIVAGSNFNTKDSSFPKGLTPVDLASNRLSKSIETASVMRLGLHLKHDNLSAFFAASKADVTVRVRTSALIYSYVPKDVRTFFTDSTAGMEALAEGLDEVPGSRLRRNV